MRNSNITIIGVGLAMILAVTAPSAFSQSLGDRMDQIAAEKARAKSENQSPSPQAPPEEREFMLNMFQNSGSCPAWTENTYSACDCEANSLPDRNAKIAWRTGCGVMALEKYSGATFDAVAQLECGLKSEFMAQVRRQIIGSGAAGSVSYASQAWERWKSSTGCKGSPLPQTSTAAINNPAPPTCQNGDLVIPDMEMPFKNGVLTCGDGTRKEFEIELKMGFVFRIKDSEGNIAIYNASQNKDPKTGAYLLNPEFVAGAVCQVQATPTMTRSLDRWLKDYVKDYTAGNGGIRPMKRGSSCIGVRG